MKRILRKVEKLAVTALALWIRIKADAHYLERYWAVRRRLEVEAGCAEIQPWTQAFADQYYKASRHTEYEVCSELEDAIEQAIKSRMTQEALRSTSATSRQG